MLGYDLITELRDRGHEVNAPSSTEINLTLASDLDRIRKEGVGHFDWIVNCAAYTNVDEAENHRMAAMKINAVAAGGLAVVAGEIGARLLHISTDFVFDGKASTPYREEDAANPINSYGQSKLMGEENVLNHASDALIVRTSWLYGLRGKCFPKTMIRLFEQGKQLRVVADQTGCPTFTPELAGTLTDLLEQNASGIYHACGPNAVSWHQFAQMTLEAWCVEHGKSVPEILAVTSDEFATAATRPAYSVLATEKILSLGIAPMEECKTSLLRFVARLDPKEVASETSAS